MDHLLTGCPELWARVESSAARDPETTRGLGVGPVPVHEATSAARYGLKVVGTAWSSWDRSEKYWLTLPSVATNSWVSMSPRRVTGVMGLVGVLCVAGSEETSPFLPNVLSILMGSESRYSSP